MQRLFDENRVIEMAWEDRTTFDAIKDQYGITQDFIPNEDTQVQIL